MNIASALPAPPNISRPYDHAQWHRRVVKRVDLTGVLVFITPLLLGTFFVTGLPLIEIAMYGVCVIAALPYVGPFAASLHRNPTSLLLVLLFLMLAIATGAAFARVPPTEAMLQSKALAATAVWASIFIVAFGSISHAADIARLMKWIHVTGLVVTGSVYASLLLHRAGVSFGEVLEFGDGTTRTFGPLGDQVGFILVLPALISLAAAKPLHFGIHVGALLLTATRGALVCLVVGVLLYLFAMPTRATQSRRRRLASAAALLVAVVVWASPLSAVLRNRLFEETMTSGPSFRLIAIETGTTVFRDNFVLGLGFNGFGAARPAVYADWRNPTQAANGLSRTANQYLQTATDGGVLALLLLMLFVGCCCRYALRIARSREATPELAGAQLWLIAVLVGNQGALWLLSDTSTGFFVFAVAGITARVSAIDRQRRAALPVRHPQS